MKRLLCDLVSYPQGVDNRWDEISALAEMMALNSLNRGRFRKRKKSYAKPRWTRLKLGDALGMCPSEVQPTWLPYKPVPISNVSSPASHLSIENSDFHSFLNWRIDCLCSYCLNRFSVPLHLRPLWEGRMASSLHLEEKAGAKNRSAAQRRGAANYEIGQLSVQKGWWWAWAKTLWQGLRDIAVFIEGGSCAAMSCV